MANKRAARRALAPLTALFGAGAAAATRATVLLRRFDQWALASITQPARRQAVGAPSDFGLPYEEIRLRSDDDVDLYGWLIAAPGGLPAARGHDHPRPRLRRHHRRHPGPCGLPPARGL